MKNAGIMTLLFAFTMVASATAQEGKNEMGQEQESLSYYEQRAKEDALYEQSLAMGNKEDEKDFWKDQKRYEKDLRKRNKEAYRAYMKGKSDAYSEHAAFCGQHCRHSEYYYQQAQFYDSHSAYHYPRSNVAVRSNVRVTSPRVGFSIF